MSLDVCGSESWEKLVKPGAYNNREISGKLKLIQVFWLETGRDPFLSFVVSIVKGFQLIQIGHRIGLP